MKGTISEMKNLIKKQNLKRNESRKTQLSLLVALLSGASLGACGSNGFQSSSSERRPSTAQTENSEAAPQPPSEDGASAGPAAPSPSMPQDVPGEIAADLDAEGADDTLWDSLDSARESFLDSILNSITSSGPSSTKPSSEKSEAPEQRCETKTISEKLPLDVLFNIDVSTSMGPYIDTVKANVVQFAKALELQSRDVRIASVGFVDEPVLSIGFTDPETFQAKVSQWNTLDLGNRSFQEGGQESLEHSLWMLSQAGRPDASYVIVHISDAIIFAPGNDQDFSTTQLATLFRELSAEFEKLAFFDSVPSSAGRVGANQPVNFSPRDQMNGLRSQSGSLLGQSLSFPFSASTLTSELPGLIETTIQTPVCN